MSSISTRSTFTCRCCASSSSRTRSRPCTAVSICRDIGSSSSSTTIFHWSRSPTTSAGLKLRIAAKIDAADRQYFESEIAHLFEQPHVEYVGEIGERDKCDFLGQARALLFPIDWPEPFGLVMIEAMSCGTPCIAWRAGSVPEIISEGENGFIVETIDAAVDAVQRVRQIDRAGVRRSFERRFSSDRMTRDYLELYARIARRKTGRVAA